MSKSISYSKAHWIAKVMAGTATIRQLLIQGNAPAVEIRSVSALQPQEELPDYIQVVPVAIQDAAGILSADEWQVYQQLLPLQGSAYFLQAAQALDDELYFIRQQLSNGKFNILVLELHHWLMKGMDIHRDPFAKLDMSQAESDSRNVNCANGAVIRPLFDTIAAMVLALQS